MSKRNVVEWAVLIVSVLGIAALVGVLVIEGLNESRPADPGIELLVEEARQGSAGWIIPAEVTNTGDQAAEALVIEASASVAGETETSELSIDYLPAGTTVEIAFSFSARPDGEVAARLIGFRVP